MTSLPPAIGSEAPDFVLRNQHGEQVQLSGLRGRPVMIVFYPWAFSRVCTGELCELRDNTDVCASVGAELLTVSCDAMFSLRAWADEQRFEFALLSDFWPHGAVASLYGVFDADRGAPVRGTFMVDSHGILRWSVINAIPDARNLEDYRRALVSLA